eukprot:4336026-Amphidinium_carterae.1
MDSNGSVVILHVPMCSSGVKLADMRVVRKRAHLLFMSVPIMKRTPSKASDNSASARFRGSSAPYGK